MKIAIASDHRGIEIKNKLIDQMKQLGHDPLDMGTDEAASVDYPDYAEKVSEAISHKQVDRGILICGTGIGMCITANKFRGVRAAPVFDEVTAELSRRHNDANILCLSADLIGEELMHRIIEIFINTPFEEGRHARRLDKIGKIEQKVHDEE